MNLRLQPSDGLIRSIRSHSNAPALRGRSGSERSKALRSLKGRSGVWADLRGGFSVGPRSGSMQKLHTDLGLSLRFAPLVAFTETERTWAEAVNTAGYRGVFLLWQEHHRVSLALTPGHPAPLLTRTCPLGTSKDREQWPGHAGQGRQPLGMFNFNPPSPHKGNHRGWVTSQLRKATPLERKEKKKKDRKSLHKANPTGFAHSNPLPGVAYLRRFSHLLF